MSLKTIIKNSSQRRYTSKYVEGVGEVEFASLTAGERLALEREATADPVVLGVMLSLCDGEGNREYNIYIDGRELKWQKTEYEQVANMDASLFERLVFFVNQHCTTQATLTDLAEEELGNLESTQTS